MSPTPLLNLPADMLHAHANGELRPRPMAEPSERKWSNIVCGVAMALAALLIVALH